MTGTLRVELEGNNWGDIIKTKTNMTRTSSSSASYTAALPFRGKKAPYLTLSATHLGLPRSTRTLFSISTFVNLFFLYLLLSMGQQVQRLRTEVSFLADEARDLRMHAMDLHQQQAHAPPPAMSTAEAPAAPPEGHHVARAEGQGAGADLDSTTAIARVVLRSAWGEWTSHPTVRSVAKGLGWLWHAVVWIVHG